LNCDYIAALSVHIVKSWSPVRVVLADHHRVQLRLLADALTKH
jgi:hypothetical protein